MKENTKYQVVKAYAQRSYYINYATYDARSASYSGWMRWSPEKFKTRTVAEECIARGAEEV